MNRKYLLLAFAISGFTALVYEIVWTRPLEIIFGSTIYAVSTMLTTFFIGFALGSYLFRNISDRSQNSLKLFAILQLGIGLYGLGMIYLLKILPSIYLPLVENSELQLVKFLFIFLVLIIPTTLLGATWPVMNKSYINLSQTGKDVGRLYASNSFGSFLGPIAAGFILIPLFGIRNTSILASLLNILLGIFILTSFKGGKDGF